MLVTCFILWKHDPTPENPSNFQQKRGYISQTCHFVTKKNTPRVSPGVHRNTLRRRFTCDFSQEKRRQEEEEVARVQSVSRHAVYTKNFPQGPKRSDTHPGFFFVGGGRSFTSKSGYIFLKGKTSFFISNLHENIDRSNLVYKTSIGSLIVNLMHRFPITIESMGMVYLCTYTWMVGFDGKCR